MTNKTRPNAGSEWINYLANQNKTRNGGGGDMACPKPITTQPVCLFARGPGSIDELAFNEF